MTSVYEQKREARIERIERQIARLRTFAKGKDLSMFGEERSGIPLGQPILIGHHSEKRHKRHLERINRLVTAGYDALKKADRLEERLHSIKNCAAITVDNPDAVALIKEKISKIESVIEKSKRINKILRPFARVDVFETIEHFKKTDADHPNADDFKFIVSYLESRSHFYACKETRMWSLSTTNDNAEIRRLKKRLIELERISESTETWQDQELDNGVSIKLEDGQIRVFFPDKPTDILRDQLKRSPLALKWSSYSGAWVRKHTATTCGRYFKNELERVCKQYGKEVFNV